MATPRTAVIVFGRMNPPTTGHAKLIELLKATAKPLNGDVIVFASPSRDPQKNPLPFGVKVSFLKRLFRDVTINANASVTGPLDALAACSKLGYRRVVMVVGSDRLAKFESLRPYVRPKSSKGFDKSKDIDLDQYSVVPITRDPDSEDPVEGMSASKMRTVAQLGNFTLFRQGVPTNDKDLARQLYDATRRHMGIK